jgi:hypothetical protein
MRKIILWRRIFTLLLAPLLLTACGPNREAVMSQAAQQQASIATGGIGNPDEVRSQARDGAQVLKGLSAFMARNPRNLNPNVVAAFTADMAQLSSGLDAIADSRTDDQFTSSVFNMCDARRRVAAPRVGHVLVGMANNIRGNPAANVPSEQVQQTANYFDTFGERMINIPTECDSAKAAMQEAAQREQAAEAQHQANVAAAVNAAELIFAGADVYQTAVSAAAANRPVIQNNYYYGR